MTAFGVWSAMQLRLQLLLALHKRLGLPHCVVLDGYGAPDGWASILQAPRGPLCYSTFGTRRKMQSIRQNQGTVAGQVV